MATEVTVDAPATQLPPIDPNVKIPPSVRAAAEKANSFFRQSPSEPSAEAAPEPGQPSAEAAPELPVTAPVTPEPPPADPNWEHQYKSVKGRFDAQRVLIEQLQGQLSEMGNEVMELNRTLKSRPPPPPPEPPKPDIDPEDINTYGQELMEAIARTAAATVKKTMEPEITKLTRQTSQVQQQLTQNIQKDLVQTLNAAVPNWEEINSSPEFKSWLNLPDIYSGRKRSQLAEEARLRGDNNRVVAFFQGYLAEHPPQAAPPAASPRQPAMTLEQIAAPGRGRPASSDAVGLPAEPPIITRDFIKQFYARVRANGFLGREAEKDRIEREIFAAQNSNRV